MVPQLYPCVLSLYRQKALLGLCSLQVFVSLSALRAKVWAESVPLSEKSHAMNRFCLCLWRLQIFLEDAWVLPAHKPVCARLSCPPLYLTLALRPMQELGARLEGNQEGLTSCHSQKTAPAPRTKVGEIQPRKFWKVLEGLPAPTSRCQGPGLPATCGTGRGHGREVTQLENLGDEPTPRIGVTGWTWHFSPFVAVCGPFEEDEG